jgi:hypothetical protein
MPIACAGKSLIRVNNIGFLKIVAASISIPGKPKRATHPVTPLSLSGFFLFYLISQSGIFVPGLAVYSFSYAFSSLVGLKKAGNYIS